MVGSDPAALRFRLIPPIVKAADAAIDYISIKCLDWKIIPLENLIAKIYGKSKLLAWISSAQEAKLALEVLEIGVDGVIAELSDGFCEPHILIGIQLK